MTLSKKYFPCFFHTIPYTLFTIGGVVGITVVTTVVDSGLLVVIILTVDISVVVSTLQLLFIIMSILLKTVVSFVVADSVVVVIGVVGLIVEVGDGFVGKVDTNSSDMIHDSFIALPAL